MYGYRELVDIIRDIEVADTEERLDVLQALPRLRDDRAALIWAVTQGWSVNEASEAFGILKPYRFYRAALNSLMRVLHGGKP